MFRTFALASLLVAASACKPRDPDAGGLLSDDSAPTQTLSVAAGGDWTVTCRPADADQAAPAYLLTVAGAVSETDESQDVVVTVIKRQGAVAVTVANKDSGHGQIAAEGPVFLGFAGGVLTATRQGESHSGVLTLGNDPAANGLKVTCSVAKAGGPVTDSRG